MTDWDDLRFFLAVARAGNVTAAASHLRVNHSTVSRRITAMEAKHGVRLFERVATGYELTASGECIVDLAEDIERRQLQVERLLFAQDSRLQGKLTLTLPHDLASYVVLPHMAQFSERYPDIDLNLLVSAGLRDLKAREADIAVRLTATPPDYLVGKKVAQMVHGVYRAPHYQSSADGADKVILWGFEQELPAWAKAHFPNATVAARVDDLSAMYAAVQAGMGLARMPCFLPDARPSDALIRLDLSLKPSSWGVWILSHKDLRATERVRVCREFLQSILLAQKDLFEGRRSRFE